MGVYALLLLLGSASVAFVIWLSVEISDLLDELDDYLNGDDDYFGGPRL